MNKIKVIKTEQDYKEALKLVESLMSRDPNPDSDEGEQLSLLSTLIQDYEDRVFPEVLPSPIEAIKFRMEQANLRPADLVPFIGSRGRVSEILSGKRQLTLEMIRALSEGLGIPAKVLIQKTDSVSEPDYQLWDDRLVNEMKRRGYFELVKSEVSSKVELLKDFFSVIGSPSSVIGLTRKSSYRSSPLTDRKALAVWVTRVVQKASEVKDVNKYKHGIITLDFMRELAKLSLNENSPLVAQKYLEEKGIILVVEPHFSKTYLDGATVLIDKDYPVIGLTLRHDRLDNFWFTLMHELAHISKHYESGVSLFFDELEDVKAINIDEKEKEADEMAEEALLPKAKWEVSPARLIPSSMAAKSLANELGVNVAIIAGQIRHKGNKYIYLNKIVKQEKVRKYFPAVRWVK